MRSCKCLYMTFVIPYLYRWCQRTHLRSVFAFFIDALDGWFVIILWSPNKASFWHPPSITATGYRCHSALLQFIPFLFFQSSESLDFSCLTFWAYSTMVMTGHLRVVSTVLRLWLVSLLTALENESVRNSVNLCLSLQFLAFAAVFPHSSRKLM